MPKDIVSQLNHQLKKLLLLIIKRSMYGLKKLKCKM